MTSLQLDVIRVTLHELRREPAMAAALFYSSLFKRCPSVRPAFGDAFDPEGKRLLWVLSAALAGLSDPRRFVELLTIFAQGPERDRLANRESVGAIDEALQWMLKHYLAEFYTADVQEAWQAAYREVSAVATASLIPQH